MSAVARVGRFFPHVLSSTGESPWWFRRDYPAGSFAKSRRSGGLNTSALIHGRTTLIDFVLDPSALPSRNSCPRSEIFRLSFLAWIFRCANTP